nr:13951_t:CDS:2 [Entrophospora candida]
MIRLELEDHVKKEKSMHQPSGELSMLEDDGGVVCSIDHIKN